MLFFENYRQKIFQKSCFSNEILKSLFEFRSKFMLNFTPYKRKMKNVQSKILPKLDLYIWVLLKKIHVQMDRHVQMYMDMDILYHRMVSLEWNLDTFVHCRMKPVFQFGWSNEICFAVSSIKWNLFCGILNRMKSS